MLGRTTVRGLQAGSAAAGIGAILTTVDLTLCAGGGTLIASALAANEAFKKSDELTQKAALRLGEALDQELAKSDLTPGRQDIVLKILKHYWPQHIEIADGDRNATKVLAKMVERIAEKPLDDDVNERAVEDFKRIVEPALEAAFEPLTEEEAIQKISLERSAETRDDVKAMRAELAEVSKMLLANTEQSGDYQRLREAGITEKAILTLIESAAQSTDNLGQAWIELENRFSSAVSVQEEGRITSNHGDFVDTVLRRVAELSRDGEYKGALSEIEDAIAKQEAEKARLLDSGVKVAMVDGDPAVAADLLVRRADLEAGGRAKFEDLRALQNHYWESGRDKGINLHAELAIEVNQINLSRAVTWEERGTAGNDLGTTQKTLGEGKSDTELLETAVLSYENALAHRTRDRAPLDWAMTQMNLGNALSTLGLREDGNERLESAVVAYENALKERTRERSEQDWAMTQMNLGITLRHLAKRKYDIEGLEGAVLAFQNALKVWTLETSPSYWAKAQMNLGNALSDIGILAKSAERLQDAVNAYERALAAQSEKDAPLDWARTVFNLGSLEVTMCQLKLDMTRLISGENRVRKARTVFEAAQASQFVAVSDQRLELIDDLKKHLPG